MSPRTLALIAALLLVPLPGSAAMDCSIRPPRGTRDADLPGLAKLTQDQALPLAIASLGHKQAPKMVSAELEIDEGCLVWSFDLRLFDKPGIQDVKVDAGNGKILLSEYEGPGR